MRRTDGIVAGHPVLNANSRQMALALAEANLLDEFHTTLDTTTISAFLPRGTIRSKISRRDLPSAVHARTISHPLPEIARLLRRHFPRLSNPHVFAPDKVLHAIDVSMSRAIHEGTRAVYAFEDGALATFSRAQKRNIPRLYDLPIGYWRAGEQILREEIELQPRWASTISMSTVSNHTARMERKDAEIAAASAIVVASTFTANSLRLYPQALADVEVIPYGAPPVGPERQPRASGKLRVLYVGSLTQRKGLSYLFDAVNALKGHVELTVVGRELAKNAMVEEELSRDNVTWTRSTSHQQILQLMRNHDVLVFPSLFEGFGLVLPEALSQGTPIIATNHTGAPDIITDGKEGWVVPIRSSAAIVEKLDLLLRDPALRVDMSVAARTAAQAMDWSIYRRRLAEWARRSSDA